jgi:hypothetical protein
MTAFEQHCDDFSSVPVNHELMLLSTKINVKRWTDALRSGEHVQGHRALHVRYPESSGLPDEKCCLGVLCLIENRPVTKEREPGYGTRTMLYYEGQAMGLPEYFTDQREGDVLLPFFTKDALREKLTRANDGGLTFPQIADLIDYFVRPDVNDAEWNVMCREIEGGEINGIG